MKLLIFLKIFITFHFSFLIAEEIECQGAVLRILNKATNEKSYFTVPLSQTLELDNTNIIVHRCVKVEQDEGNDEIALISHKLSNDQNAKFSFFGWIFKTSQYINSPKNSVFDIKLEECLLEDPIFLKNSKFI